RRRPPLCPSLVVTGCPRLAYFVEPTPLESPCHNQVGVLDISSRQRRELTGSLDRSCAPFGPARGPPLDRRSPALRRGGRRERPSPPGASRRDGQAGAPRRR